MESDKFITVCESVGGVQQIAIVDMTAGNSITRQKISAEAAIMNPGSKIIALKGILTFSKFIDGHNNNNLRDYLIYFIGLQRVSSFRYLIWMQGRSLKATPCQLQ